jgi:hypothetical protein
VCQQADVVYALVQVRKLMERTNTGGHYQRLKFCDWVVHGQLTGPEAKHVLIEIDDRLKFHYRRKPWEFDPDGGISALVSHHALCVELGRYLDDVGVTQVWTRDMFAWYKVSKLFSEEPQHGSRSGSCIARKRARLGLLGYITNGLPGLT